MTNVDAQFAASVIADAFRIGEPIFWRRRAETLRWAQPRPREFHGKATREELSARWCALEEAARACEARARVAEMGGVP